MPVGAIFGLGAIGLVVLFAVRFPAFLRTVGRSGPGLVLTEPHATFRCGAVVRTGRLGRVTATNRFGRLTVSASILRVDTPLTGSIEFARRGTTVTASADGRFRFADDADLRADVIAASEAGEIRARLAAFGWPVVDGSA
jgi:hypothetical protein